MWKPGTDVELVGMGTGSVGSLLYGIAMFWPNARETLQLSGVWAPYLGIGLFFAGCAVVIAGAIIQVITEDNTRGST